MQQINYTIIIPHYNIPELLVRCVNSIPEREDIQVVVVDDCSKCQEELFGTLQSLNRNGLEWYSTHVGGSAGRARNVGLEHAKGEWLIFADSDDLFTDVAFMIFDEYKNADYDIVFFNHRCVLNEKLSVESDRDSYNWMFDKYKEDNDEFVFRCEYPAPWGKLIRHSLAKELNARFTESRWSNDHLFSIIVGLCAKKIKVDYRHVYMLTERAGSLTFDRCKSEEEWQVRYEVAKQVQTLVDKSKYRGHITQLYSYITSLISKDRRRFFLEFLKLYKTPYWQYLIVKQWVRNKFR